MRIPPRGKSKEEIFKTLESYRKTDLDWKSGRVLGYVYDPGQKAGDVVDRGPSQIRLCRQRRLHRSLQKLGTQKTPDLGLLALDRLHGDQSGGDQQ